MRAALPAVLAGLLAGAAPPPLAAQIPADLAAERAEFSRWLLAAPNSPYAALYHQPLAGSLTLGAGADPALAALPAGLVIEGAIQVLLRASEGDRVLPRNRDVPFGAFRIRVSGERGRSVVTVFGASSRVPREPVYHPFDPAATVDGVLEPAAAPEERRMLGLDGIEVTASLAGHFIATLAGEAVRLVVYRVSEPGSEESELQIFFRDGTNTTDTYPAGRFVVLRPLGGIRYRADFNRARNPFCAYNSVFPCPLPWAGNVIAAPVRAGEQYRTARRP